MSKRIEIKIEAKRLTPDMFLDAAKQFFSLTQGVAANLAAKKVKWVVEVDRGSSVVRMLPEEETQESDIVIDTVCRGIRALRSGTRTVPHGFTYKEVRASKQLAVLVDGESVQAISIRNGGEPEDVPSNIISIADAILEGHSHIAFGSIEGKVIALSARQAISCTILDPLERREIVCYLQTDEARAQAVKGFAQRVLASGLIHYAKEGHAVSITVDHIRIFPPDAELPSVQEIQAIYNQYK